ncbi:MAG: hypothetical protein AB1646_16990 [Thermodesulfobacteriota bacterium]
MPLLVLLLLWGVLITFINPAGEFTQNDDWGYVMLLESLAGEGKMIATGWGPGGPSAIVHVLWAWLVTSVWGYSFTMLRVSVLSLGVMGSICLFTLLYIAGVPRWLALWGTVCIVVNPLFLSQCFTFMTDITFVTLAILSLLFLHLGVERSRVIWIAVGLFVAGCSILTRQVGLMIPMAFVIMCFFHPKLRSLGIWRMFLLVGVFALLPSLVYEVFLSFVGSTPVTKSEVVLHILINARTKGGVLGYLYFLYWQLAHVQLGYMSFFLSPVVALGYRDYWGSRGFRIFVIVVTAGFVLLEAGLLVGWFSLPIWLHRNVLFNAGIGPIILKDTYILGIRRDPGMSPYVYYLLVYWTVLAGGLLVVNIARSVKGIVASYFEKAGAEPPVFVATLALIAALINMVTIALTGMHDRYLIPIMVLIVIWLLTGVKVWNHAPLQIKRLVPAGLALVGITLFAMFGMRDFMELKRAQVKAQDYVVHELGVDPCHMDGGLEFNGYHCSSKGVNSAARASWWWVGREAYLIALGPLPGYKVVKTFPFNRAIGPDGAIHILRRDT